MTDDEILRRFIQGGQRAQGAANLAIAVAELAAKGVRLTARPGEYEVNFRNGDAATAYPNKAKRLGSALQNAAKSTTKKPRAAKS